MGDIFPEVHIFLIVAQGSRLHVLSYLQAGYLPVAQPTVSEHWWKKSIIPWASGPKLIWEFSTPSLSWPLKAPWRRSTDAKHLVWPYHVLETETQTMGKILYKWPEKLQRIFNYNDYQKNIQKQFKWKDLKKTNVITGRVKQSQQLLDIVKLLQWEFFAQRHWRISHWASWRSVWSNGCQPPRALDLAATAESNIIPRQLNHAQSTVSVHHR